MRFENCLNWGNEHLVCLVLRKVKGFPSTHQWLKYETQTSSSLLRNIAICPIPPNVGGILNTYIIMSLYDPTNIIIISYFFFYLHTDILPKERMFFLFILIVTHTHIHTHTHTHTYIYIYIYIYKHIYIYPTHLHEQDVIQRIFLLVDHLPYLG